jgi:hypothetical protein
MRWAFPARTNPAVLGDVSRDKVLPTSPLARRPRTSPRLVAFMPAPTLGATTVGRRNVLRLATGAEDESHQTSAKLASPVESSSDAEV